MVGKMPPARPMSVGSWERKPRVTWGRPLMADIHNDKDQDQQGETGKGPEEGLHQALGEMGIESHGLIPFSF